MKHYALKVLFLLCFCLVLGSGLSYSEIKPGLPKLYLNDAEVSTDYLISEKVIYLNSASLAPFGAKVNTDSAGNMQILLGDTVLKLDLKSSIVSVYPLGSLKLLPSSYTVVSYIKSEGQYWFSLKDLAPFMGYKYSRIHDVDLYRLTDGSETITPEALYEVNTTPAVTKNATEPGDQKNYAPKKTDSPNAKKIVYLTFDDGPNQYTEDIVKLLEKYDQKATFFLLYNGIARQPETVRLLAANGHGIGLHGVTHRKNLFYKSDDSPLKEMNTDNKALEKALKKRTALIRTPYGSKPYLSSAQYKLLEQSGYKLWDWNVDSGDSAKAYVSPKTIETRVLTGLKAKTTPVVLLHDKACTLDALENILKWMKANGYVSKPLTEDMTPLNWSK